MGNLDGRATETVTERKEYKAEDNTARNCTELAGKPVVQVTGKVEKIFGVGNSWVNKSAPPSAPQTLGIPGGAAVMMTQHATTLTAGVNAPVARTKAQNLHRAMMGGTPTLHNIVVGSNEMGGTAGIAAAPTLAPVAGQQQCVERGSMGWSALI